MTEGHIEIGATYEENYHASPTDRFLMAKAVCSLKQIVRLDQAHGVYESLLEQCKARVQSIIKEETRTPEEAF